MSEPIPESIPTSYDPRSQRPTKRRALSPRSQTAASISTLFAKPEKALLDIPPLTSTSGSLTTGSKNQPPEIVQNVQGSSAGAGSGEFHVYKASRRREYERLRGMEEEVEKEEEDREWEMKREEQKRRDEEKTRKKRERRGKNKGGKGGKQEGKGNGGGDGKGKETKIKARVVVKEGAEGLGGEGPGESAEGTDTTRVVEEVGVVIHDDD